MVLASIFFRLPPCQTIQTIDRHNFKRETIFWNWSLRHHQFWWCGKPNNKASPVSAGGQCSHQGKSEQTGAVLGRLGWTWTRSAWLLGGRVMGWWPGILRCFGRYIQPFVVHVFYVFFNGNVRLFIVPLKNGNWVRLIGILIRTYSIHSMVGAVRVSWLISLMLEAAICRLCSGATEACGEVGGGWADSKGC